MFIAADRADLDIKVYFFKKHRKIFIENKLAFPGLWLDCFFIAAAYQAGHICGIREFVEVIFYWLSLYFLFSRDLCIV